ncbi:hypothetical protein B6U81_06715 [Thermoplasmatales archaeon ex4484_30]|nr:MAG: hypothetical protein B6U81_06715 [Thermoplasmatales archaeon ex4484_30]
MIFNCHTHIGDAFVSLPKGKWSVEELFTPPHGLKHRMLSKASEQIIIDGMKKAIDIMEKCGTSVFIDFREGGVDGVKMLIEAVKGRKIFPIILARPKELEYDEREVDELLSTADGIGISSIYDWNEEDVKMLAEHTHEKRKIFALHASEIRREDIEKIIELKPKFVVHLCRANEDDIKRIADKGIGVVICPRANSFFNLKPPVEYLLEYKVKVMLGTDNAMIVKPDIIEEMNFLIKNFNVPEEKAIDMIEKNPTNFFEEILKKMLHS